MGCRCAGEGVTHLIGFLCEGTMKDGGISPGGGGKDIQEQRDKFQTKAENFKY